MHQYAFSLAWANRSEQVGREIQVDRFVSMWNDLARVSDLFKQQWVDVGWWAQFDGADDMIGVDCSDPRSVMSMFDRAARPDPVEDPSFVDPTGRIRAHISTGFGDGAIGFHLTVGGKEGVDSIIQILGDVPDSEGEYGIPKNAFSPDQIRSIIHILVKSWSPRYCRWIDQGEHSGQKPDIPAGNPERNRIEWQSTLGWLTYFDAEAVRIPKGIDWPAHVIVDSFGSGTTIQIGDDPFGVTWMDIQEVRKALGWPHRLT
ncbi:hypothetical protein ACFV4K_27980 [Nocardia sp. NPDC059764]|uniref:hypothetical protein n=1 Tax=Nocardia sp. NPDC059764 TaxID=3346939 RepID=UPI00365BEA15